MRKKVSNYGGEAKTKKKKEKDIHYFTAMGAKISLGPCASLVNTRFGYSLKPSFRGWSLSRGLVLRCQHDEFSIAADSQSFSSSSG